jgi:hypothetical protein
MSASASNKACLSVSHPLADDRRNPKHKLDVMTAAAVEVLRNPPQRGREWAVAQNLDFRATHGCRSNQECGYPGCQEDLSAFWHSKPPVSSTARLASSR